MQLANIFKAFEDIRLVQQIREEIEKVNACSKQSVITPTTTTDTNLFI